MKRIVQESHATATRRAIRNEDMGRIEEIAAEFTTEELQEFLEGDLLDVKADPDFKEDLRRKLWAMVKKPRSKASDQS